MTSTYPLKMLVVLSLTLASTVWAQTTRYSLELQIKEIEENSECFGFNYSCVNKHLEKKIELQQYLANYAFRQFLVANNKVVGQNLSVETQEELSQLVRDMLKAEERLLVKKKEVKKELRIAENSIWINTELGQYAAEARKNEVLENYSFILSRFIKEVDQAKKKINNVLGY